MRPTHWITVIETDTGMCIDAEYSGSLTECQQHMEEHNNPSNWALVPVFDATEALDEYEGSFTQLEDIDNHMSDIILEWYENPPWIEPKIFECKDCHICLHSEEFEMVMLHNHVWSKICDNVEDILCHKCIEHRLGRPIKAEDLGYANTVWDEDQEKGPIGCNVTFAATHNLIY